MTIAACHLSPEGVVLGVDSTTTLFGVGATPVHLDYAQKLFEVGQPESRVALATWGLGQIGNVSHRTVAARLGETHRSTPYASMKDMAQGLADILHVEYPTAYGAEIARAQELSERFKDLEEAELAELGALQALSGGYCLAGRIECGDACEGFEVAWEPFQGITIKALPHEVPIFWGMPHVMLRLLYGFDNDAVLRIRNSAHWTGTDEELYDLVTQSQVNPRHLPIREAVDWIHTIIHTTIRGIKFAMEPHTCGGPIEIATITTDRPFRWVLHKRLDAATVATQGGRQHD